MKVATEHRMECVNCYQWFDPIKYRWLCPECKHKNSCCEGAPLPEVEFRVFHPEV